MDYLQSFLLMEKSKTMRSSQDLNLTAELPEPSDVGSEECYGIH